MSNSRTTNNNQQQNPRRNPFSSALPSRSSSSSRFGGSSGSSGLPGSRFSRFGRETVKWTVLPLTQKAVRFSLDGLGDPFHRLLGLPLDVKMNETVQVARRLQADAELLKRLTDVLDESWAAYEFQGAAMLYPWSDDVRKAYTQPIEPQLPPPESSDGDYEDDDDDDDSASSYEPEKPSIKCFRAIDIGLTLNILGRARANVVAGNTPLALEASFLQQEFICDDPRIVAIARATGSIDEVWS